MTRHLTSLAALAIALPAAAQDWKTAEAPILSNYRQLTTAESFVRAGEAYFDPETDWVIFQAVPPPPEGEEPSPHYSMYLAGIMLNEDTREITGLIDAVKVSVNDSANTCGWFHPTKPGIFIYGTTIIPPSEDNVPGYQRDTSTYRWAFPTEMDIYASAPKEALRTEIGMLAYGINTPRPVVKRDGYDAECSLSPDGRYLLYVHVDEERSERIGRADGNIWIRDQELNQDIGLIGAEGYDGGPFFSPDGNWIVYRSDRKGDNLLQLFMAEIAYEEGTGRVLGVKREIQLTENEHVNWAPFWHPSGRFIIYSTSEVSHRNYEVFALEVFNEDGLPVADAEPVRITHADGFDGLPVFNADGSLMMWTSQRAPKSPGEERPSSQLWLADVNTDALFRAVTGGPPPAADED
ncbi:MAG: hypothetical protein AAGI17_07215 [Planctomycetota bacterium]